MFGTGFDRKVFGRTLLIGGVGHRETRGEEIHRLEWRGLPRC